ncbi:methyltransferase domain-containing protein [Acaryochloris marina]|uniref:methyltransferase domain-containing protein n=1 Tax=Acaryochloris marina TaxID=155978 RepID=UPI001BB0D10F|nr:methyltransferase domain-containing protein [Acaryochloris marina]QUY44703.1 class I SAM-dependent methyltransferase [Acaryochloris marina S15]
MKKKTTIDNIFFEASSRLKSNIVDQIRRLKFNEVIYWEKRYSNGGNSGIGSYDKLARYKAGVINSFIEKNNIQTVIEFGCGDGNQLSLYKTPSYIGLDISSRAISLCRDKFEKDPTKNFIKYNDRLSNLDLQKAELTLSIDVIFHITKTKNLNKYLNNLFDYSKKFVLIYSTNFNKKHKSIHQVDRKFSEYIENQITNFSLINVINNPHKGKETMSDFYIYKRH